MCSAATVQSGLGNLRSDCLKAIDDRESSGSGTSIVESALPPPKRLRMEDCFLSENVSSALGADSADELSRSGGSSQYKSWSEGLLCNKVKEEVTKMEDLFPPEDPIQEMKMEKLNSAGDRYGALVTSNHTPENTQRVAYGNAPFLRGELNCTTSNSDVLKSDNILPVLEQPSVVQEKEELHSISKPNQPESKAKADLRETATHHQAGTTLEDPKKLPLSLVDFLGSVQINEHIHSLAQSMGQVCDLNIRMTQYINLSV